MDMIDRAFQIGFPFDDDNELRNIAAGFSKFSHGHLRHCVLAVDGWVCRTRCPTALEVKYPMAYRNRHGCFGIVVLAGCYADLKFGMFSCVSCGSTNDSLAWELSQMKMELDSDALRAPYYFIGDEAFTNTKCFLVPWSGTSLGVWKDSFNYHLSAMRQCIERAFSLLTQRWGIFWRPLRCSFNKWTLVCTVCAKLHNYCIDMHEGRDRDIAPRYDHDYEDDDAPIVFMNEELDLDGPRRPTGDTRKMLTELLEQNGIRRPHR
jgi:hypothetical protein